MHHFIQHLKYFFKSRHRRGFGIHSPYLFHLVTCVIEEEFPFYCFDKIEFYRKQMLKMDEKIGLIQKDGEKKLFKISSMVNDYTLNRRNAQLLFRLVNSLKPASVIEYGTTTGIETLYMAKPNSKTRVYAMSDQPEISDLAHNICERLDAENVKKVDFISLSAFKDIVEKDGQIGFLYVSQADTKDLSAMLETFFSQQVPMQMAVINNPHTNKESTALWEKMQNDDKISACIDMFQLGIIIKHPDLQKENFILAY